MRRGEADRRASGPWWLAWGWPGIAGLLLSAMVGAQPGPDLEVPFVTSPDHVVDAMLGLAKVKASDFVLDLGSGDGRIVIKAAAAHGARGMGVEIDPNLVRLSNDNAAKAGVADRAKFVEQDLFETDLAQASVITMYLLPDVNLKLRPSLLQLKPGTRIVSHDFDLGDWQPDDKVVVEVPDKQFGVRKESTLLLWTVPASVEGTWSAGRTLRLQLTQKYQMLSGAVHFRGHAYESATGRVEGNRVLLCFERHDNGRCRLGALGELVNGALRMLVDGDGRQQAMLSLHREGSRTDARR